MRLPSQQEPRNQPPFSIVCKLASISLRGQPKSKPNPEAGFQRDVRVSLQTYQEGLISKLFMVLLEDPKCTRIGFNFVSVEACLDFEGNVWGGKVVTIPYFCKSQIIPASYFQSITLWWGTFERSAEDRRHLQKHLFLFSMGSVTRHILILNWIQPLDFSPFFTQDLFFVW